MAESPPAMLSSATPSAPGSSWEAVIGLEVHVQLRTVSKLFSAAATAYGAEPNTQACDVSIALPGTLPVMNREAARLAVIFGLGIGAQINRRSVFARKHYFYPDLPKGYQISQHDAPIIGPGVLSIAAADGERNIRITRAHLEEDAGKSLHQEVPGMTAIDLNRAGTPLLEIVSEPDLRSAAEAVAYLRKLHTVVRYLDISDGNMQEGSFRCDANVSVRRRGQQTLGTRAELKNINSFRFVEKAIEFEITRQIEVLEGGGRVTQETRLYDAERDETRAMRSKEEAHDYRYFPDPDLPPLHLDDDFIAAARAAMPELPEARLARWMADFELSAADAGQLVSERDSADYFEAVAGATAAEAKTVANWMLGEFSAALNKSGLAMAQAPVAAAQMALLLTRLADRTLSGKIAKEVFHAMWRGEGEVDEIIAKGGYQQITNRSELEAIVARIVSACPEQTAQYRSGKQKVFGYLVGQIMQATKGQADPAQVTALLRKQLD